MKRLAGREPAGNPDSCSEQIYREESQAKSLACVRDRSEAAANWEESNLLKLIISVLFLLLSSLSALEITPYNLVSGLPDISVTKKTEEIGETWKEGLVWDKPLIEKFYSLLKEKNDFFVVLDIGAQTGSFTLLAKFFPNSHWYAFEPIQEAAEQLVENLNLNLISNVTVSQLGVSDRSGIAPLKLPKDTHWGLATLGSELVRFNQYEERNIPCISLDEFVCMNSLKSVDFIKIDTEGWEFFVLKGAQSTLKKFRPLILIELNSDNLRQCGVKEEALFSFLQELGYTWQAVGHEDLLCIPCCAESLTSPKEAPNSMETQIIQPPPYLYKVISMRLWQAAQTRNVLTLPKEDDLFIHFSTEDQLDRILSKYWSDAPQVVILKTDTSQVKGIWAYEKNPGGTTPYFHLYNGCIPFHAIAETKIIYQKPLAPCRTSLLDIVEIGNPVLRCPARELSSEEILSAEIQDLIEAMKITMRAAPGIGLAAPQIGKPLQLAVIEDMDHGHLTPEQLVERDRHPVPFHVIINPRVYVEENTPQTHFFEGCLSIPSYLGIVPRAESIRVECLNERAEPVTLHARGWYARCLQHEIDHLNGILYLDRAILQTLMTEENYVQLWKGKKIQEILENIPTQYSGLK